MEELPSHKQMFILIHSQDVSAQIGRQQVIHEEYINGDGKHKL